MAKITFRCTESGRGCELWGPYNLVRTETVHESGLVEGRVTGVEEGRDVDRSYANTFPGPLDLDVVRAARRKQGWSVVE